MKNRFMMRWSIPAPVIFAGLLLLGVSLWQGLGAARDRHGMLEPSRSTYEFVANPEITVDIPGDPDMLLVDLAGTNPARVGLYQYYPARTLIRWIEAEHGEGRWLAIPLAGLVSGEYWITSAPADAAAGPREMDLPAEQLDRIGAFRLE